MININATKKPIIIFASPRTGSTALGHHLESLYPNLKYYNEPNFFVDEMKNFMDRFDSGNDDYILKLMGTSLNVYPSHVIAKMFSNEVFKIKITRKDIIEQTASHYVANERDLWDYKDVDDNTCNNLASHNIEINIDRVNKSIECVEFDNMIISKISADLELYYEDFEEFKSPTKRTPLPLNYPLLLHVIKKLYSTRVS